MSIPYRKEIDGLRAVALLPVLFFHAGFTTFSGGFIGVDVFFVISGYLITSIIFKEKQQGVFSLQNFYERRARRILPALCLVLLCCIPPALTIMLPSELKALARSIIAVLAFASNFLFWKESGYFESASEEKPLLHTWSLSVEEQFYILFPLCIILFWPLGKRWLVGLIIIAFLFSLGLSELGWRYRSQANFFLPITRAWELLAGTLCAFYLNGKQTQKSNQYLPLLGIILIFYSVFVLDKDTPFPSFYTHLSLY